MDNFQLLLALLFLLVLAALWTVMTSRLLQAVIGLAITSVVLTVLMFCLGAPLAAAFELSICAGLIPAIFLSTIGLTKRATPEIALDRSSRQAKRFWYLPVILVLVGVALSQVHIPATVAQVAPAAMQGGNDVRVILWNFRHVDLLGQVVVLLGGAFGVVALLKEKSNA